MCRDLIRFQSAASVQGWSSIDDRVMGGVSVSRLRHDAEGHAIFEGTLSRDAGGGFASVRSEPMDLAAPGAVAYVLDVLGDGRRYKLSLRTDDAFDGLNYQVSLDAPVGLWTAIRFPVADFRATFRGRIVPGAPALDPAKVRQAGFLIGDGQAGGFSLAVKSLRTEGPPAKD
jgi:NADH dehydrogenase [ubiquinone] 1 alpha subcomplex assembly factor 1